MCALNVGAIILAAGASTRLGVPKQLADVGGETLLERAVRVCTAAGLSPVVVVLGAGADEISAQCDLSGARAILNDNWREGMASSVRVGVDSLMNDAVDVALLMTCDMPFVSAEHLRALLALANDTPSGVASAYAGRKGVPAVFHRGSFVALQGLRGDAGARSLLLDSQAVELKDADDVDTPQALLDAQMRASGSQAE